MLTWTLPRSAAKDYAQTVASGSVLLSVRCVMAYGRPVWTVVATAHFSDRAPFVQALATFTGVTAQREAQAFAKSAPSRLGALLNAAA
jgi:hypothetical protein